LQEGQTRRVVGPRRTEAAHLARAFNLMLDEQQSLESRLRQFVADASHELRTPVSVILGVTDLWRQGELRSEMLVMMPCAELVNQRSDGGLVEDLLLLARLDEGRSLSSGLVDLSRLIDAVVEDAQRRILYARFASMLLVRSWWKATNLPCVRSSSTWSPIR